jgi:hypothetical protein
VRDETQADERQRSEVAFSPDHLIETRLPLVDEPLSSRTSIDEDSVGDEFECRRVSSVPGMPIQGQLNVRALKIGFTAVNLVAEMSRRQNSTETWIIEPPIIMRNNSHYA